MTLVQMLQELRLRIGNPSTDATPDYQLKTYLQRALDAANRRVEVAWADDTSLSTVANQQEYDLPASVVRVDWVELGSAVLTPIDMDAYRRLYVDWRDTSAGTPTEYVIYGRKLILHPKPSANSTTIRLRTITAPATISASGPAELASQDHGVLLDYAAALYHAASGDPQRAKPFFELFNAEMALIAAQMSDRKAKK